MMDLYGRKVMMITGLVLQAGNLLLMTQATSIGSWLVLMAVMGVVSPLFSIGGNAMVADLIPNHQRAQAYALLRMAINLGVVTGPLIGGWIIAEHSFQTAFWTAASLLLLLAGLAHWLLQETRPEVKKDTPQSKQSVWKDRHFITILLFYTFSVMGFIEMFILMPIYLKQNFQILENQSSLLFSVNALIVVLPVLHYSLGFTLLTFSDDGRGGSDLCLGAGQHSFSRNLCVFYSGDDGTDHWGNGDQPNRD